MSVEGTQNENQLDDLYKQIVAKTREQHRLFSAHWELTYRCNEQCSHCYLDVLPAQASAPDELTTAECFRVLDELADLGVLNLSFSGGEILTRRDFFEIAEYARARRFLLRLLTNGLAITPAVADRLAALHPYAVEMSVYGARAETHDQITQRARSFELTTRAFQLLHARGVRTVVKMPLMHENFAEFDALRELANAWGAQFRYDITITPKASGNVAPLRHRLTDEDRLTVFRATVNPALWQARPVDYDRVTCGIAQNALLIDPYGNVFPCVEVRHWMGNVRERTLSAIWNASPGWQELRDLTWNALPLCRACPLTQFCVRCHGLAQLENGDLRAPAPINCREAAARRQVFIEKSTAKG